MHITIKSGFKLRLSRQSSEWKVESVQNLKFPEDMIEVTQIASFLHVINLEAQQTILEQDTTVRSKHKAKINIEIRQTPDNLKICPLFQNMR